MYYPKVVILIDSNSKNIKLLLQCFIESVFCFGIFVTSVWEIRNIPWEFVVHLWVVSKQIPSLESYRSLHSENKNSQSPLTDVWLKEQILQDQLFMHISSKCVFQASQADTMFFLTIKIKMKYNALHTAF